MLKKSYVVKMTNALGQQLAGWPIIDDFLNDLENFSIDTNKSGWQCQM